MAMNYGLGICFLTAVLHGCKQELHEWAPTDPCLVSVSSRAWNDFEIFTFSIPSFAQVSRANDGFIFIGWFLMPSCMNSILKAPNERSQAKHALKRGMTINLECSPSNLVTCKEPKRFWYSYCRISWLCLYLLFFGLMVIFAYRLKQTCLWISYPFVLSGLA